MKNKYIKIAGQTFLVGISIGFANLTFAKVDNKIPVIHVDSTALHANALDLDQFIDLKNQGSIILDTRSASNFAKGFIEKSINIGWKGSFKNWVPKIFTNKNQSILLITDQLTENQINKTLIELGYDNVKGYLVGGIQTYQTKHKLDSIEEIAASDFLNLSTESQIVDIRAEDEFEKEHIDNAVNFPLKDLTNFNLNTTEDKKYYIHCQSGYRSMIAVSILKAKNVKNIINIQGGYQALKKIKEEN